jgi:hypothetical protein
MAIKIIKGPDIYLTQAEHDRLHRMWVDACRFTTEPPSFEDFVISQKARGHLTSGYECGVTGVGAVCQLPAGHTGNHKWTLVGDRP